MEYRTLGRTDLQVSAIALGGEGFVGKSRVETQEMMDYAIGKGVNFIDMYTSNPDVRCNIGTALMGRRNEFIIQGHLRTTWETDSICTPAIWQRWCLPSNNYWSRCRPVGPFASITVR